jgi:hypothetical protein
MNGQYCLVKNHPGSIVPFSGNLSRVDNKTELKHGALNDAHGFEARLNFQPASLDVVIEADGESYEAIG